MSQTIEARSYRARQPGLRPRWSTGIIEPAGSFRTVTPMPLYGGDEERMISAGSYWFSSKVLGGVKAVLIAEADLIPATAAISTAHTEDFATAAWSTWAQVTNAALLKGTAEAKAGPRAAAQLRVQRLAAIQAVLGLSTSDFAQVLGLSRPGLYKWLNAAIDVKLQEGSRERLAAVERLSKQWRGRSASPLSSVVHEPLTDGSTVLSLLIAEHVDEAAIVHAFDELAAKLAAKPKSRSQKLADAGFTRRPSARSLPPDE